MAKSNSERRELFLNTASCKTEFTVDIPLIRVGGEDMADAVDSVVMYVQDHADELFKEVKRNAG